MLKKIFSLALVLLLIVLPFSPVLKSEAAVSNWQKGATFFPGSSNDFASDSFKQSLAKAQAAGVTHVALVIPYYQSNIYSTDIGPGWNTPSDDALVSAIDYAHSLGMKVMLTPHAESYGGEWRAQINPGDRDGWFTNYGNLLVHLATLGQAHGVEILSLGTELVNMTIRSNTTNTSHWSDLIARLRSNFRGQLTYGANATNNNDNPFENEKKFIDFWPQLDFVGLSAYYSLDSRNHGTGNVEALKASWDGWNVNDIKGFAESVGKPVVFTEVGYRSLTGAHIEPWNWGQGGGADQQEQANDYEALMSYWNDYSYLGGVYWWYWDMNPNAGGDGDTGYTPQNKLAQSVISKWFSHPVNPNPGGDPTTPAAFGVESVVTPDTPTAGQAINAAVTVKNSGGATNNLVTDIEVYDQNNNRILQKFVEGQNFAAGGSITYNVNWTAGTGDKQFYRVAVGVFSSGWSTNLYWNNEAAKVVIQPSSNPGGGGGTPTGPLTTDIWWPSDGSVVQGTQPFKAMLPGREISTYRMFWQVDGGQLNPMFDSTTDYPHKEAWVDVSGWHWQSSGNYQLNFVSQDESGNVLSQRATTIKVQ